MTAYFFNIDVVGSCNLRCPSCPVGNSTEIRNPTGFMEVELLAQIADKALGELHVSGFGLFNWTEPLLHSQLPEMVIAVQSRGIPCFVSSNLNILPDPDRLMAAEPASFRISCSGFTQPIYSRTHRGGRIERVKSNMRLLAEAKQKQQSRTHVHLLWHRYLHNTEEEELMREYTESLGFSFQAVWAFMMPLEKILAYEGVSMPGISISAEDQELVDNLALPLHEALEIARVYKDKPCSLLEEQITLDHLGRVQLCCGVFDTEKYSLADYLSTPIIEIQRRKHSQSLCSTCRSVGVHVYGTYGAEELDQLGETNLVAHQLNTMFSDSV
jgi:wyosine [tRNA(Phe)-imidazoG37] synthetase (radical SAM superfamily)